MSPRRMTRAAAAAAIVAGGVAGCTSASRVTPPPSTSAGPTTTPAPGPAPAPASTAPCSTATVIAAWPRGRVAAQLIAIPALDGALDALDPVIARGVGGVLLLGGSLPPDFRREVDRADGLTSPRPFVMADEEGGGVQRLAGHVSALPWPRAMAATMTPQQAEAAVHRTAADMRALGVDVDLAPVLDLDDRPGPSATNPDGQRSFSADPTTAATYGTAFLAGLRAGGVVGVAKHFPGLGGATANTDNGPAASTLSAAGLGPFRAAVTAGVPAVMVSNATVLGASSGPAGLSKAVIGGVLEGQLGFRGMVLTDSLSAGAVRAAGYDVPAAAVAAVNAGADMVLFGSTLTPADRAQLAPAQVASQVAATVSALTEHVSPDRLDAAAASVVTAKGVDLCDPR